MEQKEVIHKLREHVQQHGNLIQEVKDAFIEEVNQRKEISLLKKKDQIENLERGKNFHYLYKKKLVERILEKKERGDRVIEQ